MPDRIKLPVKILVAKNTKEKHIAVCLLASVEELKKAIESAGEDGRVQLTWDVSRFDPGLKITFEAVGENAKHADTAYFKTLTKGEHEIGLVTLNN